MNVFTGDLSSSDTNIKFFTAKIDDKGRILIPAGIRKKLNLKRDSEVFAGVELLLSEKRAEKEECTNSNIINGDGSSMAEYRTVAPVTGVQFPSVALPVLEKRAEARK